MNEVKNYLLCGVGGQGTVLASKIIAYSAIEKGISVRTSETIGMSQRGGCVVSHVRCGEEINSPLIPKRSADVLIAFEPSEAVRCVDYLREGGIAVVCTDPVYPVTVNFGGAEYDAERTVSWLKENVKNLTLVDGREIAEKCGSGKALNIALLTAAAVSGGLQMTVGELKDAVRALVKPKFVEMNLAVIDEAEKMYSK